MNGPTCGKCGKVMTPADSKIHPELFLHDACLPDDLKPARAAPKMEYTVVYHSILERLVEKINVEIGNGWEPLGGVGSDDVEWYQAMVRRPARE